MEDWSNRSDDEVFGGASEQPGSQASYWREIEVKRRLYELQRRALDEQIRATASQRDAIDSQRQAIKAQNDAVAEMRNQSKLMLWSVVGIFVTALVTLASAFIG